MDGLEFEGLRFEADGKSILRGVSGHVAKGETLALLGPSGCGKTTLLRMVAGLEAASGGDIRFDGESVRNVPAHRRGFGMMFQDHALFPHMDCAGNIEFGLKRAGWEKSRRAERVAELLALVDLRGFEKRSIEKLSGGERQRIALARALAPEPRLLMLDEPLASLDRGLRERLVVELRGILQRLGLPAIYVTHDQAEAFAIADRIAIMNAGEIVRVGMARDIWDDPKTVFVARFLGMDNIVTGERDGAGWVETAFGKFGPVESESGEVTLLLRAGVRDRMSTEPTENVAFGEVESVGFRGDTTSVVLRSGNERLEFLMPGGNEAPEPRERVGFTVDAVQELALTPGPSPDFTGEGSL
ncbi:MAG: ABC transporter ATP-binding protein [Dehalococcoidia bacterium]